MFATGKTRPAMLLAVALMGTIGASRAASGVVLQCCRDVTGPGQQPPGCGGCAGTSCGTCVGYVCTTSTMIECSVMQPIAADFTGSNWNTVASQPCYREYVCTEPYPCNGNKCKKSQTPAVVGPISATYLDCGPLDCPIGG